MKKSFIFAALLCTSLFCAAAEVAEDALYFAVDFDDTTDAVKSAGRAAAAEFRGTKVFEEGISGKAIRLGEKAGCPLYYTKDTLDAAPPPGNAVRSEKQRLTRKAAKDYLWQNPTKKQPRMDVIEVWLVRDDKTEKTKVAKINHIKAAY